MPISPDDVFALAERLATMADCEAVERSAISRAYYGCLLKADSVFPQQGAPAVEHESSHAAIIYAVAQYGRSLQPGRTSASQLAQLLPRLKRLRNIADYRLDQVIEVKEYSETLVRARKAFSLCEDVVAARVKAPAQLATQATQPSDPLPPAEGPARPSLRRVK